MNLTERKLYTKNLIKMYFDCENIKNITPAKYKQVDCTQLYKQMTNSVITLDTDKRLDVEKIENLNAHI